jgi:spore maturation protein CgeB
MAKWGFIPMKLFDIVRSGGFPITDRIEGLTSKFPGMAPYGSARDLYSLIDKFLEDETTRSALIENYNERLVGDTFVNRAQEMVDRSYYENWKVRKPASDEFFGGGEDVASA